MSLEDGPNLAVTQEPGTLPSHRHRVWVFTDERMRHVADHLESQTVPTGALIELAHQDGIDLRILARPWIGDGGFRSHCPPGLSVQHVPDWSGRRPFSLLRGIAGLIHAARAAGSDTVVLVLPTLSGLVAGGILLLLARPRLGVTITVNRGGLGPVEGALAGVVPSFVARHIAWSLGRMIAAINSRATTAGYVSPALVPSPAPPASVVCPEIDWADLEMAVPHEGRDERKALFVGRLEPEKGCRLAIEAFGRSSVQQARLIVIGTGSLLTELEARAAELGANVEFVGPMDHKRVLAEMSTAQVLLVPSEHEGFGLVAFEGVVQGCIVLHSGVDGLPEATRGAANAVAIAGRDPIEWGVRIDRAMAMRAGAVTANSATELHALRQSHDWVTLAEATLDAIARGTH